MPPVVEGLTEPEEPSDSPLSRLAAQMAENRGSRPSGEKRPLGTPSRKPSSGRLVKQIIEQLEILSRMDPRLTGRARDAVDALTHTNEREMQTGSGRGNIAYGGGSLKTPV